MQAMSHKMTLSLLYEVIQLPEMLTDTVKVMGVFYGKVYLTHFVVEMLKVAIVFCTYLVTILILLLMNEK